MKHLLYVLLFCPLAIWAQEAEYLIFENAMLNPRTDKVLQFEALVAAHNKKYHGDGPYGVRVYEIGNGPNVGKYMWIMGPTHWSTLDTRPDDPGHTQDWVGNVIPNLADNGSLTYWRFQPEMSRFPKDFNVSKLLVWQVNVAEDGYEKIMSIMDMVHKVQASKLPDETYGVYTNELSSTSQGNDLAIVWFFDKWSWMSEDSQFDKKFDEVHGAGSFEKMLADWMANTDGVERELWIYREDLSGIGPMVKAAERQ
jgi:hypothetical protein